MKKGIIGIAILAFIAIALFAWIKATYNGLVSSQEGVETAWAQVENVYQRRADLIPNLVETVKGYAKHEQETLEGVIEARANATKVTIDPKNMTPEDLQKYQAAQGDVTNALSRLIAVSESYPDLKANQNSWNCKTSSKEPRTALPLSATSSTRWPASTTPSVAPSPPTLSLESSTLARSLISRLKRVPTRLPRWTLEPARAGNRWHWPILSPVTDNGALPTPLPMPSVTRPERSACM